MRPSDWLGYLEHQSAEELYDFTANAGKGGYTVFGAMTGLQGFPWCAVFVHAVIGRPDILGKPHPGCRVLQRRMRRKGLWRDKEYHPKPGDLCFCSNRHTAFVDHVGIVEAFDGERVTTIDGNGPCERFPGGGAVVRRVRDRHDPVIVGYGAVGERIQERRNNKWQMYPKLR